MLGALIPLHSWLLGFWGWLPIGDLSCDLVPMAVFGFVIAVVAGAPMLNLDAVKNGNLTAFKVKFALVVCEVLSAELRRTARA